MSRPTSSSTTPHAPIAPTAPQAVHAMAMPTPLLVDASLPGYLLPAAINALGESAAFAVRRRLAAEREAEGGESSSSPGGTPAVGADNSGGALGKGKGRATTGAGAGALGSEVPSEMPLLVDEAVAARMERMGIMVGGYVAEKLTLARAPLATHLDMIKFICKDLFLYVYGKQIDNLRTNHRGVFVLQSHAFPPLAPLSSYRGPAADLEAARIHLIFPQALIQGALARLGMNASVLAESSALPQCTFQIRAIAKHTSARDSLGPASLLSPQV